MSVQAAELIGTVEIVGADEAIALLTEVGTAVDTLNAQLATLGAGAGDGLDVSLTAADEALATLQTTADETSTSLAALGANTVGLDELATQADAAGGSISALDAYFQEFAATVYADTDATTVLADSLATVSTSADASAGSLAATDTSLASVAASADAAAGSIATAGAAASTTGVEADGAATSFDILGAAEGAAATSAEAIGGALEVAAIGLGVVALAAGVAGGVAIHMAGDFQEGMTSLVTGAGESESNIKMVGDAILQMSVDTATSTSQLTAGMFMIGSAGIHGAEGLAVLKDAAEGARVGGADLGTVADATTTILKDFGKTGVTAANAVNLLVATVASGKTHMQDLAHSLSQVLPVASSAKVKLNDVMGAMATMTAEGVPAANAATYLRQTILALDAPSAAAEKALKSVGLTTSEVSTEMQKSLPNALAMITEAVGKKFPIGSAAYVAAIKNISGGSKTMQGMLDLTGSHLKEFEANVTGVSDAVKKGGNSILGWSLVQQDFNFKIAQAGRAVQQLFITVGTQLLPVFGQIVSNITPVITAFTNWLVKSGALTNAISAVVGVFHQIGAAFNVVFGGAQKALVAVKPLLDTFDRGSGILHATTAAAKPLLDTFDRASGVLSKTGTSAHGATSAINPFIAIFQNVKNVIQAAIPIIQGIGNAIKFVADHWSQIQGVFQTVGGILSTVFHAIGIAVDFVKSHMSQIMPIFQQIGGFLSSTLAPALQQLKSSWDQIVTAIKPILPQLKMVGAAIALVAGAILVGLIAALAGVISFIAKFITGLAMIVTGLIQTFSGVQQVLSGVTSFIIDLVTGHFGKLQADLDRIMSGITAIFQGGWNIIQGIFTATIGAIQGFCNGFAQTIVRIFQDLSNTLVGHSIIPDMVNAIVRWISQLPGRVMGFINAMVNLAINTFMHFYDQAIYIAGELVARFSSQIQQLPGRVSGFITTMISTATGLLNGFVSTVFTIGANIVNSIANGIRSGISNVTGAISAVTAAMGKFLPHSPAEEGELSHLNEYGPNLVKGFSKGIIDSVPTMKAAITHLVQPATALNASNILGNAQYRFPSMTATTGPIVVQVPPTNLYIDGRKLATSMAPHTVNAIRLATGKWPS